MYLITESLQIIETFTTLNVRQLPADAGFVNYAASSAGL